MFIDHSLTRYLEQVQSNQPTPGGGSVSALAGALAAALAQMVANLTVNKKAFSNLSPDIQEQLQQDVEVLKKYQQRLQALVDEDTQAFDEVIKAFKLPKTTETEQTIRLKAIQLGYQKALEVPLECAEVCLKVLKTQHQWAMYGNENCVSDIGVGVLLAYSGVQGALLNVLINLNSIKEDDYRQQVELRVAALHRKSSDWQQKLLAIVYQRLDVVSLMNMV